MAAQFSSKKRQSSNSQSADGDKNLWLEGKKWMERRHESSSEIIHDITVPALTFCLCPFYLFYVLFITKNMQQYTLNLFRNAHFKIMLLLF